MIIVIASIFLLFLVGVYLTCKNVDSKVSYPDADKNAYDAMAEDKFFNEIYDSMKSN
jgi:hypothetical protein